MPLPPWHSKSWQFITHTIERFHHVIKKYVFAIERVHLCNATLSSYAENLKDEAKARYKEKIRILNGLDPLQEVA